MQKQTLFYKTVLIPPPCRQGYAPNHCLKVELGKAIIRTSNIPSLKKFIIISSLQYCMD